MSSPPVLDNFDFEITGVCDKTGARTGVIKTPHGNIETPNFLFCGTKAAVKSVPSIQLRPHGVQAVLANTYHLMLAPGADLVAGFGGLHKFMSWDGPMFTDSGGYQVFCMGHGSVSSEIKRKGHPVKDATVSSIEEEGAMFRSYLDGSKQFLTPERSIQVQQKLGADLITVFDECTAFHVPKAYTEESMHRSHRWEKRSYAEYEKGFDGSQALYGIMQGGVYNDLRDISGEFLNSNSFFGHAIGGSLGKDKSQLYDVVGHSASLLSKDRPTHLLGIGLPEDILATVSYGIDTYDCVSPTRVGRHGWVWTKKGKLNLLNSRFKNDERPIDEDCPCSTCQNYSRGYLHHLFKTKEQLGGMLASIHNIQFMMTLMTDIREAIKTSTLPELRTQYEASSVKGAGENL